MYEMVAFGLSSTASNVDVTDGFGIDTVVGRPHMLSPGMMYSPSTACSTPLSSEYTRSKHSSRIRLVV